MSCVLHHLSRRTCLKGSWGQVRVESDRKPTKTKIYILVSHGDRYQVNIAPATVSAGIRAAGAREARIGPGSSLRGLNIELWGPKLSGSLATRYSDFSGFRPIFGQTWPPNLSRTTGVVLQCRLHQKSPPQTNSKVMSWQFGILKSPPPTDPLSKIPALSRRPSTGPRSHGAPGTDPNF